MDSLHDDDVCISVSVPGDMHAYMIPMYLRELTVDITDDKGIGIIIDALENLFINKK